MLFRYLLVLLAVELLFWFQTAHAEAAHPVINEVMWAGSDLSSSDEWFELYLPACDTTLPSCLPQSLGAWTITYLKSTGAETVMLTFPTGFQIQPDQYLVIANQHADVSRLLTEPAFISAP